jgi:hypothetical protein
MNYYLFFFNEKNICIWGGIFINWYRAAKYLAPALIIAYERGTTLPTERKSVRVCFRFFFFFLFLIFSATIAIFGIFFLQPFSRDSVGRRTVDGW